MNFTLKYHKKILKFLTVCDASIAKRFYSATEILSHNPYTKELDIKALNWVDKWSFRLRIGKYRFKYVIINHDIVIYFYDADSRWDIYK